MSLRSSSPEKIHVQKKKPIIPHSRRLEKINEVFANVAARIHSVLHPHDPSSKMQAAITMADKEMKKEVRSVPGGHEAFLEKMNDVPWMKPLIHMVGKGTDELRLGQSILEVDFKGYSTLLAEGKIPPDILLQFMARFYAGVTKIATSNGGLLFRTPMGDRVEFAFDDPSKAEEVAKAVKSFMANDFLDRNWKKRLSHFGIAENWIPEAHTDAYPDECVAIRLFRFSPRRILPVYSREKVQSAPSRVNGLDFAKNVKTAVKAAQLCPMRPAAMMAEKPDMAKEYKFVAGLQCICEGKPLFKTGRTEMKQKLAGAILRECSASSSIQVFKAGEKGELVFFSRNPAELLQLIWKISEVCRTSEVQCKAGVFGGVFHASEIYPEVQRGWPDVHGKAYAKAIRAANFEEGGDIAEESERIIVGQEVIDGVEMDDGSVVTSRTVSFKNMGYYTVYIVNAIAGNVRLRQAPAQNIEELKRKLAETKTGKVQFNGNLRSACNFLKREGRESMYMKCSPRTDIAQRIVAQLITFFEQNRENAPISEQNSEKIIEQIKENPRRLVDFLEAHDICMDIFLARSDRLTPNQRVFADKLLEFTKGTEIVRIVLDEEIQSFSSASKPASEEDVAAQDIYTRFVKDHKISEEEEELIILFFLAGKSLNRDSISHYSRKRVDVWGKTVEKLMAKKILKFEEAEKGWSLAVDPELLEGCPMRKIRMAEQFHELIGRNQLLSGGLYADPKEKIYLLGHAIEHLASLKEPDFSTIKQAMDEIIGLCDSVRDYRLAFEYVERKLELLERTTTGGARKAPATLIERKGVLMERSIRARNLNYGGKHLDSLRQLLSGEMDAVLSPSEKVRVRIYLLTALLSPELVEDADAQEEFNGTKRELDSSPSSAGEDGASSRIITQLQHLSGMMSLYRPSQGKIHDRNPESYEAVIASFMTFCNIYGDSLDPYSAIAMAKVIAACTKFYLEQKGDNFSKMDGWLRFAEDIANRHKERFIATEKLTGDIGRFLYNLASNYVAMARRRQQMKEPAVADNILRHVRALRRHAEENADEENLGLSLHLEVSLLNHQDKHAEAWELFKKLLSINMGPAKAVAYYINAAEYLYKIKGTPEGDMVLARHYLKKAKRLLFESGMSPPKSYVEEFKKWDNLVAEELGVEPLSPLLAAA